jgi:serine/threonine-protein kinase
VEVRAAEALSRIGRYPVEEEIDRSASGVVYRGMHPGLRLPVAIKLFAGAISRDPEFATRFKRETAAIAALGHPGIVRLFDVDQHGGALCVVTEYVAGTTLRGLLLNDRRLQPDRALHLFDQVLAAVGAVHSLGIVHGHLKPENVFVAANDAIKVADFGISHLLSDSAYAAGSARLVHTGAYLSPEQILGEEPTAASDVYALAAMLFELLDGQPPFTGPVPTVLHAHLYQEPRASSYLPKDIAAALRQGLAKDPAARFSSCVELADRLRNPGAGQPAKESRLAFLRLPIFGT